MNNNNQNLYWPIYKNLEKEVLKLADNIYFCDEQKDVYSPHIADLIVRCSIEIEAISKKLYELNGGNMNPTTVDASNNIISRDLYFDTDCLKLLEDKWIISKKEIQICASNMYFKNNSDITPLHKSYKRGTSGSKWQQAYQALKHDRYNNLEKGTIINLINALGALFILNLYYKDETIKLGYTYLSNTVFDNRVGSDVFSVNYFDACSNFTFEGNEFNYSLNEEQKEKFEKSIYIKKYENETIENMFSNYVHDNQIILNNFYNCNELVSYVKNNPNCLKEKNIGQICLEVGGEELFSKIVHFNNFQKDYLHKIEVILNKNEEKIYPDLNFGNDNNSLTDLF